SRPRNALTEQVTPDPTMQADVSAELADAVARANRHSRAAEARNDHTLYLRSQLDIVLGYIRDQQRCEQTPARTVAEIAVALHDHEVRDALFALADSPHADAAEQLWAQLTRTLPGQNRAEAAT